MEVLKNLKIQLIDNPIIPPLGIYLEKMKILIWRDTCTPIFMVALAKSHKHPKCPSTNNVFKTWYLQTMEYYLVISCS